MPRRMSIEEIRVSARGVAAARAGPGTGVRSISTTAAIARCPVSGVRLFLPEQAEDVLRISSTALSRIARAATLSGQPAGNGLVEDGLEAGSRGVASDRNHEQLDRAEPGMGQAMRSLRRGDVTLHEERQCE